MNSEHTTKSTPDGSPTHPNHKSKRSPDELPWNLDKSGGPICVSYVAQDKVDTPITITVKSASFQSEGGEIKYISRTTFSHPGEDLKLKRYLGGKATTQIYQVTQESTPSWVLDMERGLREMGYRQDPPRCDWYKTDGEAYWQKTIWPA